MAHSKYQIFWNYKGIISNHDNIQTDTCAHNYYCVLWTEVVFIFRHDWINIQKQNKLCKTQTPKSIWYEWFTQKYTYIHTYMDGGVI